MEEIWKDIKGYEGYQVSNMGRVKSLPRNGTGKEERILNPSKKGYRRVCLSQKDHKTNFLVHRLVAEAFIPNPNHYPQVNHRDENKINNRADNLEWCTARYNSNYGTRTKRSSRNRKKPVMQYSLDRQELCYWFSPTDASEELNKNPKVIFAAASGRRHSAYGYLWKYAS